MLTSKQFTRQLALVAALVFTATQAKAALVGHWPLDDGAGTTAAESQNNYDGTLFNNPVWNSSGMIGTDSLNFPSAVAGYIDVGNVAALNISGPITISTWWKNPGGSSWSGAVLTHGNSYFFGFGGNRTKLWFGFNDSSFRDFFANNTTWTADTWYHVAATMDGSSGTIRFYVNGVADGSSTTAQVRPSNPGDDTEIARNENVTSQRFHGDLDDIGIWNEALDAKKIALINGLGRFSGVNLADASVDNVLAVYTAGSGSATAGSEAWEYKTGLGSSTVGATGGSVGGGDAYIVLDASANGVGLSSGPTVSLSGTSVDANDPPGTLVGTLSMAIVNGPYTFTKTGNGNNHTAFEIPSGTNELRTTAFLDAAPPFEVEIQGVGIDGNATNSFTITLNPATYSAFIASAGVTAGVPGGGEVVATLSARDSDASSITTFGIVGGRDDLFQISGNELQQKAGADPGAPATVHYVTLLADGVVDDFVIVAIEVGAPPGTVIRIR
jgi:hypothetical protein